MLPLCIHNDGTHPSRHYRDCVWLRLTRLDDRRNRNGRSRRRREEKALLVADASSSRLRWHARADEEDEEEAKGKKDDHPIIRLKGRGERGYEALTRSGLAPISTPQARRRYRKTVEP